MSKKFLVLPLFFCCFSFWSKSQTPQDSLKTVIASLPADTNKVNAMLELSSMVFGTQPDTTIHYALEAIDLAKKLYFQRGLAYALKNIGLAYYVKGDFQQVENYWKESLKIFQSIEANS